MTTHTVRAETVTPNEQHEKIRALVIESDVSIAQLIVMTLRYEGWEVDAVANFADAETLITNNAPDVAVCDISAEGSEGCELIAQLRAEGHRFPVLYMTAPETDEERVSGLTVGGDDSIAKPFSLEDCIAKIRGLIRRARQVDAHAVNPVLAVGDLRLNEDSYEVERDDERIALTNTEFELLRYLMRHPNRVLSKSQILDRVWAYDFAGRSSVVELYISYLRKKIDSGRHPMVHTVRGAGYMLKAGA